MTTEENKELKEKILKFYGKWKKEVIRDPFFDNEEVKKMDWEEKLMLVFGFDFFKSEIDEATKQAEKKCIEKVSSISLEDFDKFIDKLKSELNCSLPSNFDCDETALKVVDNLASELKQKLTNHTPKEQTKPDRVKSDKGRSNAVILQNETPIRRDKSVSAEKIKLKEKRWEKF